jgi:hypothetical protein
MNARYKTCNVFQQEGAKTISPIIKHVLLECPPQLHALVKITIILSTP